VSQKDNAAGAGIPSGVTSAHHNTQQPDGSTVAVTAVTVDPPCPGRRLWAYRVVDPLGHVHLHRCGPPREDGHLRTAPCGEVYVIVGGGTA
jgi:hypothetical protein